MRNVDNLGSVDAVESLGCICINDRSGRDEGFEFVLFDQVMTELFERSGCG